MQHDDCVCPMSASQATLYPSIREMALFAVFFRLYTLGELWHFRGQ